MATDATNLQRDISVKDAVIDCIVSIALVAGAWITNTLAEYLFPKGIPFPFSWIIPARDLATLLWVIAITARYFRFAYFEINKTVTKIIASSMWKTSRNVFKQGAYKITYTWRELDRNSRELTFLILLVLISLFTALNNHNIFDLIFPPTYWTVTICLGHLIEKYSKGKFTVGRNFWLLTTLAFIVVMIFNIYMLYSSRNSSTYTPTSSPTPSIYETPDLRATPTPINITPHAPLSSTPTPMLTAPPMQMTPLAPFSSVPIPTATSRPLTNATPFAPAYAVPTSMVPLPAMNTMPTATARPLTNSTPLAPVSSIPIHSLTGNFIPVPIVTTTPQPLTNATPLAPVSSLPNPTATLQPLINTTPLVPGYLIPASRATPSPLKNLTMMPLSVSGVTAYTYDEAGRMMIVSPEISFIYNSFGYTTYTTVLGTYMTAWNVQQSPPPIYDMLNDVRILILLSLLYLLVTHLYEQHKKTIYSFISKLKNQIRDRLLFFTINMSAKQFIMTPIMFYR